MGNGSFGLVVQHDLDMNDQSAKAGQIARFALVSGVSFTIDFLVYAGLASDAIGLQTSWAKRASFACIIVWGYFAHKHFTFRNRGFNPGEPARFALLFLAGWALNSLVHDVTATYGQAGFVAFIAATAAWACLNFLGQKHFVFRQTEEESSNA